MATLKLTAFAGENPKVTPRLLPQNAAQIARNTRLDDGSLTPVRRQRFAAQLPASESGYGTIYRHLDEWMGWPGTVYAAPGPVAADRLYIMGDGAPKMMVGELTYPLAVPFPATGLTATLSGASTDDLGSTRLYVYTWVTSFSEESEPSPASGEIYWKPGQTVTLSGFVAAPTDRTITKQRIYRSQTSLTGTQLFLIAERNVTTSDFVDSVAVDAFQEPLPSSGWTAPPDTLTGLVSLPNGMMAAFSGKDIYFSEPYRPHAWPESYVLTVDYDVVGLGAFGTTLVIATKGNPYMASGSAPELMLMEKLELNLPCVNARSIVDLGYSVAYASHDGLVLVSQGGARVVTESVYSRDEWLKLNPYLMTAGQYDGRYFTTYSYIDTSGVEYRGALILDMTGEQPFVIRSSTYPQAMFYELTSGRLYMLDGLVINQWDAEGQVNELQAWKSKLFVLPRPVNFGAILVEVDEGITEGQLLAIQELAAQIVIENQALIDGGTLHGEINGAAIGTFALNGDAMTTPPQASLFYAVNIFADRKLVATIGTVNKMARLPSGFLSTTWEVEVVSDSQVSQVTMATTGAELMQV